MEAVVFHDVGEATVETRPRPEPEPDGVVVRVRRVQMSVTDCWAYLGRIGPSETMRARMDEGGALARGHEFCGDVVETGADVTEFEPGDRVYAPGKIICGECRFCERGHPVLCENSETIGTVHSRGALAEYFPVSAEPLCKLPDDVSDAEGAALQPFSSAVMAMEQVDIATGSVVAVVGAGVMGSQCGQLAALKGAERVFAVDIDPTKVELAEEVGMIGIDARETDPAETIADRTDGVGPDLVIEAVGGDQDHGSRGEDPLAQAVGLVRTGGTVLQVGIITSDEISFNPLDLRWNGIDLVHPLDGVDAMTPNTDTGEYAAHLVATDRVSIDQFVTHELDGLDSFERAVEITMNKPEYDALGPAQIVVSE